MRWLRPSLYDEVCIPFHTVTTLHSKPTCEFQANWRFQEIIDTTPLNLKAWLHFLWGSVRIFSWANLSMVHSAPTTCSTHEWWGRQSRLTWRQSKPQNPYSFVLKVSHSRRFKVRNSSVNLTQNYKNYSTKHFIMQELERFRLDHTKISVLRQSGLID